MAKDETAGQGQAPASGRGPDKKLEENGPDRFAPSADLNASASEASGMGAALGFAEADGGLGGKDALEGGDPAAPNAQDLDPLPESGLDPEVTYTPVSAPKMGAEALNPAFGRDGSAAPGPNPGAPEASETAAGTSASSPAPTTGAGDRAAASGLAGTGGGGSEASAAPATAGEATGGGDTGDDTDPPKPDLVFGTVETFAAPEDSAGGLRVATLEATDPEGAPLTYTLTDAAGEPVADPNFMIFGNEIQVRPGAALDYESAESHLLYVIASDGSRATAPEAVTIGVTDVAEAITLGDGGVAFTDTGVTEISVTGGDGADTITGTNEADALAGADGDDALDGAAGDDALDGGTGADTLDAGSGADTLTGGAGDDVLDGGADADRAVYAGDLADYGVTYDAGTDTFTITDQNAANGDEGRDIVTRVESFDFNGTILTAADLRDEADRQANTAPTDIAFASGGAVGETVDDGGTIALAFDPSGATVGRLATTDGNAGDSHAYTLVSDPSGRFEIVGDEVRVRAGQEIDFETDPSFDITVRSTDRFGASHDEVLTITVTDFEGTYSAGDGGEAIIATSEENVITGGAGDDTITGGGAEDTLSGGDGDDVITGGSAGEGAADSLSGGADADTFVIADGFGNDTIVGGETATTGADSDTIDLSAVTVPVIVTFTGSGAGTITDGTHTITFSEIERLILTEQADVVDASADTAGIEVVAAGGADTITTGSGDDIIHGGHGNDTIYAGVGHDTVYGGAGDDRIEVEGQGGDFVDGGEGSDDIHLDDIAHGTDNIIQDTGTTGIDTLHLDDGGSSYEVQWNFSAATSGIEVIDGSAQSAEWLTSNAAFVNFDFSGITLIDVDEIQGTTGDDWINGSAGADTIAGLDGNDTLYGRDGADSIEGGAGNDYIDDGPGADDGTGADTLSGGAGDDTIWGGDDADIILGGTGADSLEGEADADTFIIEDGFGNDTISGGEGGTDQDLLDLSLVTGPVTVTYMGDEAGTITDGTDTITFSEVELLILTDQADQVGLLGFDGSLNTGDGDDTVLGIANGTVDAGHGDDSLNIIFRSTNTAEVHGGTGADRLSWQTLSGVDITLSSANDGTYTGIGDTGSSGVFTGFDDYFLSAGADMFDGTAATEGLSVSASYGEDTILGGSGSDTLRGGSANNSLVGGAGNDVLTGNSGNDVLSGGAGADDLRGGNDADTFIVEDGFGNDTIDGGEGGTDDDAVDFSAMTGPVNVTLGGAESGQAASGADTLSFDEIERLVLTDGADTINDTVSDDGTLTISAMGGDDRIVMSQGQSGAVSIDGGTGDDTLRATAGQDTLAGGEGADSLRGYGNDDLLHGGTGDDIIYGDSGDDTVFGEDGADRINGGTGADTLDGGAGDDLIAGDSGDDSILGGTGEDTVQFTGDSGDFAIDLDGSGNLVVSDTVGGGQGTDTLSGVETLRFDDGDLALAHGTSGADTITTGEDLLVNGALEGNPNTAWTNDAGVVESWANGDYGVNSDDGGRFVELDVAGSSLDNLYQDVTTEAGETYTLTFKAMQRGTQSEDIEVFFGGVLIDTVRPSSGSSWDTFSFEVTGAGGVERLEFRELAGQDNSVGPFLDQISLVDSGDDLLVGGDGADLLSSGFGEDVLVGGTGADTLVGGAGADRMQGGNDADTFILEDGFGNDTIIGGDGGTDNDVIDLSGVTVPVIVTYTGDKEGTITDGTNTITFSGIEEIILTDQADVVDATADSVGVDIHGEGGNDTLVGGSGADSLFGGTGADSLTGGAGNDRLDGNDGNDTILGGADNDFIRAGNDNDSVDGGTGNDTIDGEDGDDFLAGGDGDDEIEGGDDNDTLAGGSGDDTLDGQNGDDVFVFSDGFGNDTVIGGEFGETGGDVIDLSGLTGPITVTYNGDEAGTITDGTNTITFSEVERLILTDQADVVDATADSVGVDIDSGLGDDTIAAGGGDDTINAGSGYDSVFGGAGSDTIDGGGGFDSVDGGSGDDVLFGGTGDDTLLGGAGNDTIDGGGRSDSLFGGEGDDSLFGNNGDDTLEGGAGSDTLLGGDGADTFVVRDGFGNDTIVGGEGGTDDDVIDLSALTGPVTVTYTGDEAGTITDGTNTITFSEIERIITTDQADHVSGWTTAIGMNVETRGGDDTVAGSGSADTIDGGDGADSIQGQGGDDSLVGGSGDDTFSGGDGADTIDGGAGTDRVTYWGSGAGVVIDLSDGLAESGGEAQGDSLSGIEEIEGSAGFGDTITADDSGMLVFGHGGDDSITGGLGNDSIYGDAGADTIQGGAGEDLLTGGTGNDSIGGGEGADFLQGEAGDDTLAGGLGADQIYGWDDSDTFLIEDGFGADTVVGGEGGTDDDLIDLSALTGPVTVTYTGDEAGTITDGADTITFSEVERLILTDQADVVDASADSVGVNIDAAGGNDSVQGGAGADTLDGGTGDDTLEGGAGDDSLSGGSSGVDRFIGGAGADTMDGTGSGWASIDYGASGAAVNVDLASGTGTGGDAEGDVYTDINSADGSAFDDTLTGTATRNVMLGRDGNDSISGGGGDDDLLGQGGDDTVDGGVGADVVSGGDGSDYLVGGDGNDTVRGDAGADTLDGGTGRDLLYGGDGDDYLQTSDGADTMFGGSGNDTIDVRNNDNLAYGGDDADFFISDGSDYGKTVFGGEGGADFDTLSWATESDAGDEVNVTFTGDEAGTASIRGQTVTFSEIEAIEGTQGADTIDASASSAGQTLDGQGGDDSLVGGSGADTLSGGDGSDTIRGGDGDDLIDDMLGPGDGSGDDVFYGEGGNDEIYGGDGADSLYGGTGDDTISGQGGDNLVDGGDGSDLLINWGSMNAETLRGGADADTFQIWDNAGTITIEGGATATSGTDADVIDLSNMTGPVTVTYTGDEAGTISDGVSTITFSEIEQLILSEQTHVVDASGDGAGIEIVAAGGDDTVTGGSGDDIIDGGTGNDVLSGGGGGDTIDGGAGDDTISGGAGGPESDAPILLMNFEDGASGTAADSTGNGHNGTYQNGATAGGTGWNGSGTALQLDGANDYVEIADDPAFDLTAGTIAIRFNADDLAASGDDTLFSRDSSGYDGGGHVGVRVQGDGAVTVRIQGTSSSHEFASAAGTVSSGSWHHVALSFGPDGVRLYVDGVEAASDPYTGGIAGNDEPWTIGANQSHSGDGVADSLRDYFDGQLDEFALFDSALDATQIADIAASGVTVGSGNSNALSGGEGSDTFLVSDGFGNDTITGGETGSDTDTIDLSAVTDGVTVTASGDGAGTILSGSDAITFSEIETLILTDQADSVDLAADSTGFSIFAGAGDDTIGGGTGADSIWGGDGSDVFQVGALEGNDVIDGGIGGGWTDAIQLQGMGSGISITGNTIDGDGWTMVLDAGSTVDSQSGTQLFLSDDVAGVITFDAGGEVDFTGVETVSW